LKGDLVARIISRKLTVFAQRIAGEFWVGHKAEERRHPQQLIIDFSCQRYCYKPRIGIIIDDRNISTTIDYAPMIWQIKTELQDPKRCRRLIETLAEEIAEICFRNKHVRKVKVRVRKPNKIAFCAAVGIQMEFTRED
jgi:dihydroneopterin aldolase